MRFLDTVSAWLVCVVGALHLAVGHAAFVAPTAGRIWFASAGFLLIVTGLANLAAQRAESRMQQVAALVGAASILLIGVLLGVGDRGLMTQPQTLLLLTLALLLMVQRVRGLAHPLGGAK